MGSEKEYNKLLRSIRLCEKASRNVLPYGTYSANLYGALTTYEHLSTKQPSIAISSEMRVRWATWKCSASFSSIISLGLCRWIGAVEPRNIAWKLNNRVATQFNRSENRFSIKICSICIRNEVVRWSGSALSRLYRVPASQNGKHKRRTCIIGLFIIFASQRVQFSAYATPYAMAELPFALVNGILLYLEYHDIKIARDVLRPHFSSLGREQFFWNCLTERGHDYANRDLALILHPSSLLGQITYEKIYSPGYIQTISQYLSNVRNIVDLLLDGIDVYISYNDMEPRPLYDILAVEVRGSAMIVLSTCLSSGRSCSIYSSGVSKNWFLDVATAKHRNKYGGWLSNKPCHTAYRKGYIFCYRLELFAKSGTRLPEVVETIKKHPQRARMLMWKKPNGDIPIEKSLPLPRK